MKRIGSWMTAAYAAGALCLATAALAQAPGSPPETLSSSSETVIATVMSVDQKTREVKLKDRRRPRVHLHRRRRGEEPRPSEEG